MIISNDNNGSRMPTNYYRMLGIPEQAGEGAIKHAYFKIIGEIAQYFEGNTQQYNYKIARYAEIYRFLSNSKNREQYDQYLTNVRRKSKILKTK